LSDGAKEFARASPLDQAAASVLNARGSATLATCPLQESAPAFRPAWPSPPGACAGFLFGDAAKTVQHLVHCLSRTLAPAQPRTKREQTL